MRMTIKAISELQKHHNRMKVILNELAILEDGVDADYSSVVIDYKWLLVELEHRLVSLRERKK